MSNNPVSPALHGIPSHCPICGKLQWQEGRSVSGPIEDVCWADGTWSVAHVRCIRDTYDDPYDREPDEDDLLEMRFGS